MTDSRSGIGGIDDEVGDEPIEDSRETCGFWYSREGRCHIGPLSLELGGPCPDCPLVGDAPESRDADPGGAAVGEAGDAAMRSLYREMGERELPGDPPFDVEAGLRDLKRRLAGEPAPGPEGISS